MTRSRTPSPIPEELSPQQDQEEESASSKVHVKIPTEYSTSSDSKTSSVLIPRHYHRSMRPSSMPLSSSDSFSRRITPMGIYYPKDRMKQERQFASVVLDMLTKHAYEEEPKVEAEKSTVEMNGKDSQEKQSVDISLAESKGTDVDEMESSAKETKEKTSDKSMEQSGDDVQPVHELPSSNSEASKSASNPIKQSPESSPEDSTNPQQASESLSSSTTQRDTSHETRPRKVSIVDHIKPPPAHLKPILHRTNPETLLSQFGKEQDDDYRVDRNAPKTPANVKGKRSALHMVFSVRNVGHRLFYHQSKKQEPF